jgi:hypothetical protein
LAGTQKAATPQFYVSDQDKEFMVGQLVSHTIFGIERLGSEPEVPLADDFIDVLARAAAVMLAADTNLKTPRDLRLGAETVAAHVLRHLVRYRAEEAETGSATFHRMLAQHEIPEVMRKAWDN